MTRRDYEALAEAISDSMRTVKPEHHGALFDVTERIVLALKADNPRFSTERFRAAALENWRDK